MAWSVIQTHCNAAGTAVRNLRRQEFDVYNPRVNVKVTRARGIVTWRREQLFRDYLFVQIVDRWLALRSTIGVRQLLMDRPEVPAVVPDALIDDLKAREDEAGLVALPKQKFADGQCVLVKAGAFLNSIGIFDGQKDRDRVFVLLALLGSSRRVVMEERDLVAA